MNYCIKVAKGERYCVDLSASGNKYTVGVWDKREHKPAEQIAILERYEEAEIEFKAVCLRYGVAKFIKDVEHDPSDFNFD